MQSRRQETPVPLELYQAPFKAGHAPPEQGHNFWPVHPPLGETQEFQPWGCSCLFCFSWKVKNMGPHHTLKAEGGSKGTLAEAHG